MVFADNPGMALDMVLGMLLGTVLDSSLHLPHPLMRQL
jgi:hypothetical protein